MLEPKRKLKVCWNTQEFRSWLKTEIRIQQGGQQTTSTARPGLCRRSRVWRPTSWPRGTDSRETEPETASLQTGHLQDGKGLTEQRRKGGPELVPAAFRQYLFARLSPQKPRYWTEVVEVGAMKDSEKRFFSPSPFHRLRGCFHYTELRGGWTSLLFCGRLTARVSL